jgi:hypothetical protein
MESADRHLGDSRWAEPKEINMIRYATGAAAVALLGLSACVHESPPTPVVVTTAPAQTAMVAPSAPPPPQSELVPPPPQGVGSVIWQPGHYEWNGVGWTWLAGHYVTAAAGVSAWVPGRWVQSPSGGWMWVEGHWS